MFQPELVLQQAEKDQIALKGYRRQQEQEIRAITNVDGPSCAQITYKCGILPKSLYSIL
ncbi:hypothetical protein L798_02974 [Zootermopsis nevadensis]|uniref:Uncharacterized protein n=1 Tax=Zootermopsis nevadensis TaxID=136037 RepID=A0A067RP44_ZOONE|nr:hypothetical protein L798_02974 [Zootermopsis nevadensis]